MRKRRNDLDEGGICWKCGQEYKTMLGLHIHEARGHKEGRIGLLELKARTPEGTCLFCGDPAMKKKHGGGVKGVVLESAFYALHCGDDICRRAYHFYYAIDRHQGRKQDKHQNMIDNRRNRK